MAGLVKYYTPIVANKYGEFNDTNLVFEKEHTAKLLLVEMQKKAHSDFTSPEIRTVYLVPRDVDLKDLPLDYEWQYKPEEV